MACQGLAWRNGVLVDDWFARFWILRVHPFKVASASQRRPASVPSVSLFTCYLDMSHRGRTIHLQVHWHLQFRIIREVTFSMRRLCVNPGDPYSLLLDRVSRCAYHGIQMTGGKQAALLKPSKHATGLLVLQVCSVTCNLWPGATPGCWLDAFDEPKPREALLTETVRLSLTFCCTTLYGLMRLFALVLVCCKPLQRQIGLREQSNPNVDSIAHHASESLYCPDGLCSQTMRLCGPGLDEYILEDICSVLVASQP